MSVSKRVTVNAKITEEESLKLNKLAERENISVTAIIRLLVNGLLEGEIELEKGKIKSCPTTDEMGISGNDYMENLRYKEVRFDRLLQMFKEKGYPDVAIRQCVEQLMTQIGYGGNYNPRRYKDSGC